MKNKMTTNRKLYFVMLALIAMHAHAQSGGNFAIKKSTFDAGGGDTSSADYSITAIIGQTDTTDEISGGNFSLTGGFWSKYSVFETDVIFINGFEG